MAKYPDVTAGQTEACINRLGGWENFLLFIGGKGKVTFDAVTKTVEKASIYLRRLFGKKRITLNATDGTEMLVQAGDIFAWVDPDFNNWKLNVPGKPTVTEDVSVHEMTKNGTFAEIYDSLGALNGLRLGQGQIKQFVKRYTSKLHPDGWATFFLFTRGDEPVNEDRSNVFVASVYRRDGELEVHVYGFSDDDVWGAGGRYRFVAPQR